MVRKAHKVEKGILPQALHRRLAPLLPTSGRSIRSCRRGMRTENYSMRFRDVSSVSPSNLENVLTQLVRECIVASAVAKLINHTTNAGVWSLPPPEMLPFL